jgi:hypothetical protein
MCKGRSVSPFVLYLLPTLRAAMKTGFHNGGTGTDRNLGVGDVLFYLVLPSMCVSGRRGARVRIL